MYNKQGRYALSNRHIGHVRYASFKRGRPRLIVLAAIVVVIFVFYKSRVSDSATSEETVIQQNNANNVLLNRPNSFKDLYRHKVPNVQMEKQRLVTQKKAPSPFNAQESVDRTDLRSKWHLAPSSNCEKSSPFLIILITSQASNFETREVIRNSWCRRKMFPERRSIACVFLLGEPEDEEEETVTQESLKANDILQGSYPDNFRNSSRKLLMGLSWIQQVCPDIKYVMKTEDDVIVNVKAVINNLLNVQSEKNNFLGKCWSDEPNRNPKSRFYVSKETYPEVNYPEYCSGAGYIMSADIAERLLQTSASQKILPFDEVYAGVLLKKVGISPKNVPGLLLGRFDESSPCRGVSSAVAIHVHGLDMKHIWDLLKNCEGEIS